MRAAGRKGRAKAARIGSGGGALGMNSRGVFITLSTVLMAIMLVSLSVNLQQGKGIGNDTVNGAIAGERISMLKQNAMDSVRSVYAGAGKITWAQKDANFEYYESFPDSASRNAISGQLQKANGFLAQEFPGMIGLDMAAADLGRIRVYGKDLNVTHSLTGGFGTDSVIYFSKGSTNFGKLRIDANESANVTGVASSLPLCGACANPVRLVMTVRDPVGVQFSFDNNIDFLQAGSVDLNSSGGNHVIFSYNSSGWQWSTTGPVSSVLTRVVFNDSAFEVGPDKELVTVTKLQGFGFSN